MVEQSHHRYSVDAWMERGVRALPPGRMLQAFEEAFAVLFGRAHRTLGDVTLLAIIDRVLYVAAEQHPILSSIAVHPTGLRCDALRERARAGDLDAGELAEAARFVLVELLTILGNLTAEILTAALHAELSKMPSSDQEPESAPHAPERSDAGDPQS